MQALTPEISYIAIDTESRLVGSSGPQHNLSHMKVRSLSGVILDPQRHWRMAHSEKLPAPCAVSDIIDSYGEWSALAEAQIGEKHQYLYLADPSGFAPVFYSLIPGKALVISDTFSGAVQGVRRLGGPITLNLGHYLSLISGKSNTFRNLVSHDTMAHEIKILAYDEALFVDEDTLLRINRRDLSAAHRISNYEQALSIGAERASESIQRLVSANPEALPAITLTGGADSRMVFALLLNTGLVNKFGLITIDPRGRTSPYQKRVYTADIEIANELRQHYNLRWISGREREKIAVSYEESLAYHQSYNSNFAYSARPSKAITYDARPVITLRGGGGEVLRGSVGARVASAGFDKRNSEDDNRTSTEWLVDHYLQDSFVAPRSEKIVRNHMGTVLSRHTKGSIRERVDAFYRSTRNRGHFGHARRSAAAQDYLMHVLTNPYLVRAAEMLDYESKIAGKFVVDLLELTEPKLRKFPFDNSTTSQQIMHEPDKKFKFTNRDGWKIDYDAQEKMAKPAVYKPLWEPSSRGLGATPPIAEQDLSFIENGSAKILESIPNSERSMVAEQHELTLRHLKSVPVGSVSAKIASALDAFTPMPLDRPGMHFFTAPSVRQLISPSGHLEQLSFKYRL